MNFTNIFYVFLTSHKSTKFVFVLDSWKCHSGRRHPILQGTISHMHMQNMVVCT